MKNRKLKELCKKLQLDPNQNTEDFIDLNEELSSSIKGGMSSNRTLDSLDISCDGSCTNNKSCTI